MIIPISFTHYLKLFNSIFYMIRQFPAHTNQPASEPFSNIINQINENTQEDPQKDTFDKVESQRHTTDSSKENNEEDQEILSQDRTIKKEHKKFDPHSLSSKTIGDQEQNILPQKYECPELDLLLGISDEVHRSLSCAIPFEEIKSIFIEQSKKEKLNMCQNTDNFVTVKKGSLSSCKCIIKMWTSNQGDSTVYQLRSVNRETNRLKIILIEGQPLNFSKFCFKFMKRLSKERIIKLTTAEQIEIFVAENSTTTQNFNKEVLKLMGKTNKSKTIHSQAELLVQRIKEECNRLKDQLKKIISQIEFTLAYQMKFQSLFFKECNIFSLYNQIYKKQYQKYQKRREGLLKKFNLFDIFKQLQISQHFEQYRKRKDFIRNSNKPFDSIPYMPAVKCLQQIKSVSSPKAILQKILVFQGKVKFCYDEYFINKLRLSDMDDYLPITIFCVLAMENEQNLLGTTKMLLAYLSRQYEFQWEKKILTNLEAAFEFICCEWNV